MAFRHLVAAHVKLLFDPHAFGLRVTHLVPVEVENLGTLVTDGTHLMFDPDYIQTADRADIQVRLKGIAAALPDPAGRQPRTSGSNFFGRPGCPSPNWKRRLDTPYP